MNLLLPDKVEKTKAMISEMLETKKEIEYNISNCHISDRYYWHGQLKMFNFYIKFLNDKVRENLN